MTSPITTTAERGFTNPDLVWTPDQLAARLDEDGVVTLDVRTGEACAMGHIPGARHFSAYGINTFDTDPVPLASFARM